MLYFAMSPVGGHLAAAGSRVGGGADGGQQHLLRGDAEREAEGAIAIVGVDPVVTGFQGEAGGNLNGFVARAR